MQLMELEKVQSVLSTDNSAKSVMLNREREKIQALESKVCIHENTIDDLNRKLRDRDELINSMQSQLTEKRYLLNQKDLEKEKQRQKYTTKIAVENEKMSRELELKLRKQKCKLKDEMRLKDEKLRQMKDILNAENIPSSARTQDAEFHGPTPTAQTPASVYHTPRPRVREFVLDYEIRYARDIKFKISKVDFF